MLRRRNDASGLALQEALRLLEQEYDTTDMTVEEYQDERRRVYREHRAYSAHRPQRSRTNLRPFAGFSDDKLLEWFILLVAAGTGLSLLLAGVSSIVGDNDDSPSVQQVQPQCQDDDGFEDDD